MGINRKKTLFSLCFLAFLLLVVNPSLAAEPFVNNQGTEATGILPSNPFYFFKEWGRSIRRTLSFTDLKKAETQLGVVIEQIAEIEKLNELQVTKRDAFLRAIVNYSTNIDLLKTYMQPLLSNRNNAAVEKILSTVAAQGIKQYGVLQGLLGKFEEREQSRAFDDVVRGSIDRLVGAIAANPTLGEDLQEAISNSENDERELHAALFVERLMHVAPQETMYDVMKLQQTVIQKWTGRAQFIEMIGGVHDGIALLQVVDIAREKVFDGDTKNAINVVRQATLDGIKEQGVVSRALVARGIKEVKAVVDDIATKSVGSGELAAIAQGLIARARFQMSAAEAFAEDGSLGNAYGQVISAATAARSAAVLIMTTAADYALELQFMKEYFDGMMERVRAAKLEHKNSPNLFGKIGEAEVQIAKFGDLIAKNASVARIVSAMRAAESLLGTVDQLIKELTK